MDEAQRGPARVTAETPGAIGSDAIEIPPVRPEIEGKAGVEEAAKAFEEFEKVLRGATDASSPSQACIWMQGEFGPRFPNEPDRIKVVSIVATIAAAPAAAGPSELVGRTKAG